MRERRNRFAAVILLLIAGFSASVNLGIAAWQLTLSPSLQQEPPTASFFLSPSFDSGWMNITDKRGQTFNVTHNLNTVELLVDITGKTMQGGGIHQKALGGTVVQKFGQTYGCPGTDEARSVVQTSDEGYAIAGTTTGDNRDFWLIKTDSNGIQQWNRTYGGKGEDSAFSVIQSSDGGYAIAGFTNSFGQMYGSLDFYLVKTDSVGDMEWNKTYGTEGSDIAYSVIQTGDGGYAIAGVGYPQDFFLVKTDSAGNMQWNKTYGGSVAYSVVQTVDGGYAMAGYTDFGVAYPDFRLVKTDASGNLQWNRTYGGTDFDLAKSLIETIDGGYALVGGTSSFGAGDFDFWLIKTDAYGVEEWNRTYGGRSVDDAYAVVQSEEEGYIIAGSTVSFGAGLHDFWLVKTDSSGFQKWSKTYGSQWEDYAYSLVKTKDAGYVVAGTSGSSNGDFWVIKVNSDGDHQWVQNYVEIGLMWIDSTDDTITLCRGRTDPYWNYVRVRIWLISETGFPRRRSIPEPIGDRRDT